MTTIINEINTLASVISEDATYSKIYKQDLPKVYVPNTLGVRWQSDSEMASTERFSRFRRVYQIMYFGGSQSDCLRAVDYIRMKLAPIRKLQVLEEEGFINLEPLGFSAPFKTDTDGVYAVVGILPVTLYAQDVRQQGPLIEQFIPTIETNTEEII